MTSEQRRQHYLQAMGIESYVPRWALPGAAVSPMLDDGYLESLADDETAEAELIQTPVAATPTVESAPSDPTVQPPPPVRPNLGVELEAVERKLRSTEVDARPEANTRSLRFVLSAWQISEHIMVLDSRQLKLALPVEALLQNIVVALGLGLGSRTATLPAPELLRWPLADSSAADTQQNQADARARVQAFLAARAARQNIHHVLLMGAPAIQFALSEEQQREAGNLRAMLGKSYPLDLEGVQVETIVLPSLVAMLQRPGLKAITWSAIKHLRQSRA